MSDILQIYTIPGIPTPTLRARHSAKNNTVYNSQKTQQLVAQINLQEQHLGKILFEGPVHINVVFYMPITKSNINKKNGVRPRQLVICQA